MKKRRFLIPSIIVLILAFISIPFVINKEHDTVIIHDDLDQIIEDGELIVLTINSYASYFNYREVPMGFQYELAQGFAKSLGVELKVIVLNSEVELVDALHSGEGDLIAYNLAITNERKKDLIYCGKENISHQVLVQRSSKDALNDVTQFENDGYSLGELPEGFTNNAVVESSGTVYAYWNVVTATPITLSLSLKGPMYPQSMLNGFTPAEGATPVQWSVSWDGSEKLRSPDNIEFVQLTTIGGASSSSAEKSTSVIDSKALTIKASFSSSEAASMVADKYVGWVVLGIYPK